MAATPAAQYLFEVGHQNTATRIPDEQAMAFNRNVTKLLFISNHAYCDIQTFIAFLTMQVKEPDEDDWGKFKQVLKYMNGTKICV